MLDKIIFLNHGGGTLPVNAVAPGTSPLIGIVIVAVLLAVIIGLWVLLTRKKSI